MFCNNCGKELEAGDVFCGYCGVRQEPVQAPQESPAVEEPAAGNEGPAVGDAAQGTQAGPAAPVPGKRSPVVPIVIAVLLVAGAGAGFMLWRSSGVSPKLYYNSAGNKTRRAFYGIDGRLTMHSDGFAIIENEYDSSGKEIAYRTYNAKGDFLEYVELD